MLGRQTYVTRMNTIIFSIVILWPLASVRVMWIVVGVAIVMLEVADCLVSVHDILVSVSILFWGFRSLARWSHDCIHGIFVCCYSLSASHNAPCFVWCRSLSHLGKSVVIVLCRVCVSVCLYHSRERTVAGELTGCVYLTCVSSIGRLVEDVFMPRLQSQTNTWTDAFDWLMSVVMASTKNTKKRVADNITAMSSYVFMLII